MINNLKKKMHRLLATILSILLVFNVAVPGTAQAQESPYDPITHLDDAYAYGYGGLLDLRLLHQFLTIGPNGQALSAAELRGVDQLWKTAVDNGQAANTSTVDVQALELIYLNLGAISLPLVGEGGLLELVLGDGSVGVLREYAHAPASAEARGAAGVVSDSGGIEITQPGSGGNATINLLSLLALGNSTVITENIISDAALELGAVSAVAVKPDTSHLGEDVPPICDPNLSLFDYHLLGQGDLSGATETLMEEHHRICSGYQVADAQIVLDAPAVGTLVNTLQTTLAGLLVTGESTVNGLLSSGGLVADLLQTTGLDAIVDVSVEVGLPAVDLTEALLTDSRLEDSTGLVSIDLSTGQIFVDVKQLHGGNLNALAPNTSLLTSEQLSQITDTVTNLLTASKEQEPNGLNAWLDRILRGENKRGGLYATEVKIETCVLGLLGACLVEADIFATVGGLLNSNAQQASTRAQYEANPYDYYYVSGLLTGLTGTLLKTLLGGVGDLVEGLLFAEGTGLLGGLLGDLQTQVVSPLLLTLSPVLDEVVSPLANIIINRQTLQEVEHGAVFTVSALEVNVLDLNTSAELLHLPLATASVMAQHGRLIDLNLNVAKIGEGRDLHTGGYTYDLVCQAENWEGLNEEGLTYSELAVGTGFAYVDGELSLMDVSGGLAEPLRVRPGATCTMTANPPLEANDALRPTGDEPNPTRTPYTYFLGTDANGVVVSGETPAGQPTAMSSDGVTVDAVQVFVDAENVGDEWKNHSFTFVIPTDAESHMVNAVHAYDIDTRDIVVSKTVMGDGFTEGNFSFEYSLDGGGTWRPDEPTTITHEGSFTIEGVPVLDDDLEPTSVMIREALGSEEAGPVVSWKLQEGEVETDLPPTDGAGFSVVSFPAGPVAAVPTPDQNLDVTNSYAAIEVDKHIDGLLDSVGATTLLPYGADSMEISYTVKNVGHVDLDTIRIYDPSLDNNLFDLPPGIQVDPDTGEVTGCTLVFGPAGEEATCSFVVTFADPEAQFHYEADQAEVMAEASITVGDRTIKATATDKHGAMRLSDLVGMLPETGATTLVWVLGLGLLSALGALTLYVRSRGK